jgi:hypothetical protein
VSKSSKNQNEMDKPMLSTPKKSKQGLSSKAKNRLYAAVAIFIALSLLSMIVLSLVKDSGVILKSTDVITVGGQTVKAPELEFYYHAMIKSYQAQAQQFYLMYGIDIFGINFDYNLFRQVRDEETGETWGEVIRNDAVNQMYEILLLEQAAKAENFTLSDEQLKEVDEQIAEMEKYARDSNMTFAALLRANFGKTITPSTYRKYVEREKLVDAFRQHKIENFPVDQAALDARYTKDPSEFDAVTYYTFNITVTAPEEAEDKDAALKEAVSKKKEELESKFKDVTKDEFLKLAKELTASTDSEGKTVEGKSEEDLLAKNKYSRSVPESVSEWMFDDSRRNGDIEIVENSSSVSVYYFIDKNVGDYGSRNVRHILLRYDEEDEEVTEDDVKAKLEDIYNTWKNGAKTEESFAELAMEKSEDTGSVENGGLYEDVILGQMVPEFEAWLFDDARKPGDTDIIKTDYGFHLMYYVGEGDTARNVQVDSVLRSEMYDEYYEGLTEAKALIRHESGIARVK